MLVKLVPSQIFISLFNSKHWKTLVGSYALVTQIISNVKDLLLIHKELAIRMLLHDLVYSTTYTMLLLYDQKPSGVSSQ